MTVVRVPNRLFTFALCAALAACASVTVPPLPQGDLPQAWRNAPGVPAPDLRGWWKSFHDSQLDALVERALRDNLDVQQAALRLRAARALAEVSGAPYKPQLDLRTLSTPTPEATANYFQAGFDAEWELGLFGRAQAQRRIARGAWQTAAADLQAARVSLVAETVRAYLQLRGAQRRAALDDAIAQAAQRKLDLMHVRERLRLASALDVERASAEAAAAQAERAQPQAEIAQAAQTLALLLGLSEPDPAWLAPASLPALTADGFDAVPADLLRTRPEIARAQAGVLQAAGELGVAHADRFPRIGLGGTLTWAARASGLRLGAFHDTSGIGPVIDIPLFNWGMRAAQEHARDAELQAALLAYRQAVLQGAAEVEDALAALHAQDARAAQADRAAASLQNAETITTRSRTLGQADDRDVADAQIALARAQLEREQAREAQGIAFVALYKALGGAPLPREATNKDAP